MAVCIGGQSVIGMTQPLLNVLHGKAEGYDDVVVRQLVECVKVIDKRTIEVMFKGGVNVRKTL